MKNKIITGGMSRPILYLVAMLIVFYSCNQNSSLDGLANNKPVVQAGDGQKSAVMFGGSALNSLVPDGYIKIWEDHFDGPSLNTDNWTIGLRDPESGHLVPGGAGDYLLNTSYDSYITEEDTYIENETLVLRNQKRTYQGTSPQDTFQYTSGWVMSMHKVFFNKGYIEFRAQFPKGDKVWPALWLIPESLTWPPEWDMFEYFGSRADVGYDIMGMHLATGPDWRDVTWYSHWSHEFNLNYGNESWHIYGFEWSEDGANWYIDGELVHTLARSDTDARFPEEDMYIVMNNGTRTQSPDTNTEWPNYLVIDYVKLYQLPTSMNVESLEAGTHHDGQGWRRGTATVSIRDNFGNAVSGATVTGTFSQTFNETVSGQTGSDGTVTLTTTERIRGNNAIVDFCVDEVYDSSLMYDADENIITCKLDESPRRGN